MYKIYIGKMTKNLLHRLRSFLSPRAMQGVVERVEPLTAQELQRKAFLSFSEPYYTKDDFGNYPQQVFYINYFGDLVSEEAPKVPVSGDMMDFRRKYQEYKPGDKFP